MKLIVNLKLKTLDSQHTALLETMKEANKACDWISQRAFERKIFKQFNLHKIVYHDCRKEFNLTAQLVVRMISKVADSYKTDQKVQRRFRELGAITYDDRIIRFKINDIVSIWTTKGRLNIPFVCGGHQRNLLPFRKGEVDLMTRRGEFYLNAVCDVPEDNPIIPVDIIGVDFGVCEIATDSTGESFSGKDVEAVRQKHFYQRQLLQHKASAQSKDGKRPRNIHKLLKRKGKKESNFKKLTNHVISKKLVEKAKALNSGIAIEDLKHIRKRIEKRFRRTQRSRISGWSFFDLRAKIEYKSKLSGVPIYFVDPRNTSRECSQCGYTDKANRKTQSEFVCIGCHFSINADFNASKIIRSRAIVNLLQSSETVDCHKSALLQD